MDEMDDNMLSQYLETINPMLTQSKMDLQYLEQRGREIEDLIKKGKERIEQKRRNQSKTPISRKSRKNRKTRRR
jgi:proteasome assembly chaperone (PAC2) family protein